MLSTWLALMHHISQVEEKHLALPACSAKSVLDTRVSPCIGTNNLRAIFHYFYLMRQSRVLTWSWTSSHQLEPAKDSRGGERRAPCSHTANMDFHGEISSKLPVSHSFLYLQSQPMTLSSVCVKWSPQMLILVHFQIQMKSSLSTVFPSTRRELVSRVWSSSTETQG